MGSRSTGGLQCVVVQLEPDVLLLSEGMGLRAGNKPMASYICRPGGRHRNKPLNPDNHQSDCLVGYAIAASMASVKAPGEGPAKRKKEIYPRELAADSLGGLAVGLMEPRSDRNKHATEKHLATVPIHRYPDF